MPNMGLHLRSSRFDPRGNKVSSLFQQFSRGEFSPREEEVTRDERTLCVTGRAMDLRSMFSEMCNGRKDRTGTKERLTGSRLARGLRHAGLPLDRAVVDQIVSAYSSEGRRGGLSYADFHLMLHSKGLPDSAVSGAGGISNGSVRGASGPAMLDQQVRLEYLLCHA